MQFGRLMRKVTTMENDTKRAEELLRCILNTEDQGEKKEARKEMKEYTDKWQEEQWHEK